MRIYAVQPDIAWEDKYANFDHIQGLIDRAEPPPGSLIVLPEMFATGFSMDVSTIAEEPGGPTEEFLRRLAAAHQSTVVGGLVTSDTDGRGLNQALAVGPGGEELARYTKIHPFTYAGEDAHYAPGERLALFDWAGLRVAALICYDLRFPEVYRQATRLGASVLLTIANFPAAREAHWVALNLARAIENQAYAVAVNRCGSDPFHRYSGRSMVVDPTGMVLADGGCQRSVISATIDPEAIADYRASFPALADVRDAFLAPPAAG